MHLSGAATAYIYMWKDVRWTISNSLNSDSVSWYAAPDSSRTVPTHVSGAWSTNDMDHGNDGDGWYEESDVAATCAAPFSPTPEPTTTFAPTTEPVEVQTNDQLKTVSAGTGGGEGRRGGAGGGGWGA